jgi:hypothetical protein
MRGPHGIIETSPLNIDSYVKTYAYPGFVLDVVADQQLKISGFAGNNICFSDTYSFQALEKLVNGPICSLGELQAAEAALQALIFYDEVVLLNPSIIAFKEGTGHIIRSAEPSPKPLSGEFIPNTISDELVVCEHVHLKDGLVETSSLGKRSGLITKTPAISHDTYLSATPAASAAISMIPSEFRLPAFFSDPAYQQYFHDRGFAGKLYSTVETSVLERQQSVPGAKVEVRLPLLTWCLMSRVENRSQVKSEIEGLREEFAFARAELAEIDQRMNSAKTQREREDIARYYEGAFEAVVKAARQSNFSYVRHVIYDIVSFATLSLPKRALQIINPNWKGTNPDYAVQRSIAARSFKEILDVDAVNTLRGKGLSEAEFRLLESEVRAAERYTSRD